MRYSKRLADSILKEMLEAKGAVLVEGAKWCGKTTTAEQISNSRLYMQDPAKKRAEPAAGKFESVTSA